MKPIEITKSISITKSRGSQQKCVECQNVIEKGRIALNFHNYNDGLVLKKNVWIHLHCFNPLVERIREFIKKNGTKIGAEAL